MTKKLAGAYVQAWVWIDGETLAITSPYHAGVEPNTPAWEAERTIAARHAAGRIWHTDGEIEIDDDAEVSLSYEEEV